MFKLFRSRPPIIIINEAEHKEPAPVVQQQSLWSKYAGPVYIVTALFHFIAIIILLTMLNNMKQQAEQANVTLLRQLSSTDSLYQSTTRARYIDSLETQQRYTATDSMNNAAFNALAIQLEKMAKQQKQWQNKYEQTLRPDVNSIR